MGGRASFAEQLHVMAAGRDRAGENDRGFDMSEPREVLLAVTDGRVTVGQVTAVGDHFTAADPRGRVIGQFKNEQDAIRALMTRSPPRRQRDTRTETGGSHSNRKDTAMATKADRFPKQYFNAAMLKAKPLVLTIEEERLEEIEDRKSGKTLNKSVLHFKETETKLILNGINFDLVAEVTREPDSANWGGHNIELFCDRTTVGSDRVDCVRVRAPGSGKPAPAPKKKAKPIATLPVEPEDDADFKADADPMADEDAAILRAASNARGDLDDDIPW
jgi:hypothetical protein